MMLFKRCSSTISRNRLHFEPFPHWPGIKFLYISYKSSFGRVIWQQRWAKWAYILTNFCLYSIFKVTQQLTRLGVMREINDSCRRPGILCGSVLSDSIHINSLGACHRIYIEPVYSLSAYTAGRLGFWTASWFIMGEPWFFICRCLAFLINFCFEFILGMSVIGLKILFLDIFTELFSCFLSAFVPMWFFSM